MDDAILEDVQFIRNGNFDTLRPEMLDEIDKHLKIDTSSPANFEQDLVNHSRFEAEYQRMYAEAKRVEQEAELTVDVVLAEIVEEILETARKEGSPIPPSARGEIRRTKAILDKRYQKVKRRWIKAVETASVLEGIMKACFSKGYRMKEVVPLIKRQMFGDISVTNDFEDRIAEAGRNMSY